MIPLLKIAPMYSAEELQGKKAVVCLTKKICALDKFHLDMSYTASQCEFSVNESTMYIKNMSKEKHT
jgi:hypothetical protein